MDFESLYHFIVVMEELSFTRAAKRLYLSQQAVSSQIKRLEDECGVQLFTRKPTLLPTIAGTSLYRMAIEVARLHQNFQHELHSVDSKDLGEIRLGISYSRSRVFIPEIIGQMKQRLPNVRLKTVEAMSSSVMERELLDDKTDFYIGLTPVSSDLIQTITLRQDTVLLIVPTAFMEDFRRTRHLEKTEQFHLLYSINALNKYPFILPAMDNTLRFMFNRYVSTLQFFPHIIMESEQSDTLFFLATDGVGITIYPEIVYLYWKKVLADEVLSRVETIPLENMTESKLILAYKKDRHLSLVDHVFIDLCRNLSYFCLL